MLMRYHWGLGVGHVYAHQQQSTHAGVLWPGVSDHVQRSGDTEKEHTTNSCSDDNDPERGSSVAQAADIGFGSGSESGGEGPDEQDEEIESDGGNTSRCSDEEDSDLDRNDIDEMYRDADDECDD